MAELLPPEVSGNEVLLNPCLLPEFIPWTSALAGALVHSEPGSLA